MLLSRHQNAGQNRDIKTGNSSFENAAQFKCLGTKVTYQILIQEETKRRLNSGNACYHSVQSLLSSRLLIEDDEIGGACSTNGENRDTYRLLVGKPEGKRPLGRARGRWVDNIKLSVGDSME
jgi:hypothetical protein